MNRELLKQLGLEKHTLAGELKSAIKTLFHIKANFIVTTSVPQILEETKLLISEHLTRQVLDSKPELIVELFALVFRLVEEVKQIEEKSEIEISLARSIENNQIMNSKEKLQILELSLKSKNERSFNASVFEIYLKLICSKKLSINEGELLKWLNYQPDLGQLYSWLGVYFYAAKLGRIKEFSYIDSQKIRENYLKLFLQQSKISETTNVQFYEEVNSVFNDSVSFWIKNELVLDKGFSELLRQVTDAVTDQTLKEKQNLCLELLEIISSGNESAFFAFKSRFEEKMSYSLLGTSQLALMIKINNVAVKNFIENECKNHDKAKYTDIMDKFKIKDIHKLENRIISGVKEGYLDVLLDNSDQSVILKKPTKTDFKELMYDIKILNEVIKLTIQRCESGKNKRFAFKKE